jgi:RNA polymerase sigma-70 factor (ECF subfamily)
MAPNDDKDVSQRPQVQPDPRLALLGIYDKALPEVYGYLLSRCGSPALAEDLTSETFLAAVMTTGRDAPPPLSVAWLIGVARHKLVDHWRRQEREQRGMDTLDSQREEPEDACTQALDALLARQVLATLAPHYRAALTLRYLDGLPVTEVASYLDRGVHATEGLLVRARAAFQKAYRERGGVR